jgi:hypothetical protein
VGIISSEADKLLKALFDYARRRRDEGVYDFTQIMYEYSKYVLPEFLENSRNSLAKRFNVMIREYVATDPRYQRKLEDFQETRLVNDNS